MEFERNKMKESKTASELRDERGPTAFEKLKFYREEIKHEFNLLAMRTTVLVTCQSFLVVPFAVLHNSDAFKDEFAIRLITYAIAVLGLLTSSIIIIPIRGAYQTIEDWLIKQRDLLDHEKSLEPFALERDKKEKKIDTKQQVKNDKVHQRSLQFSRFAPFLFIVFWVLGIGVTYFRSP